MWSILGFRESKIDTVNHNILLTKMEKYGIRGLPLQWFINYLTNRQQYVSMDGTESLKQKVVCGIPQGSSLGPLLFPIYINDIPDCSEKLSFRIFADDTNIFGNCEEELPKKPVGRLSVNCRPSVDRQVTDSLPTVNQQVTDRLRKKENCGKHEQLT